MKYFSPSTLILFILYSILTIMVLFQIIRILVNKHNIFSFRFGFLAIGCVWSIFRTIFWAISGLPDTKAAALANDVFLYIPINLQFATFSLLVLFYAHVVHRATWEGSTRKRFTIAYAVVNTILLILQCVCIGVYFRDTPFDSSSSAENTKDKWVNQTQAALTGIVFLLLVSVLAFYGWRLYFIMKITKSHLQSQLPSSIIPTTFFIFCCFTSRCIYDFVGAFGTVSVELNSQDVKHIITIVVSYVFWEILPYILILALFWRIPTTMIGGNARRKNVNSFAYPQPISTVPGKVINHQPGNLSRLFMDPQRYDSDDETTSLLYKGSPVLYSGRHSPYSTTPVSGSST
ncbi:hypothetical protein CYY_002102 [Polysphondylium violaceum]|uniref:THH1/TOM1/TOM3 domain-containing protein n=1 Tax=Polysphondylium violaceum TaxID=133409 RepID=A0A8J4Q8C3_9MYCE|nr:hypothetical protein CYY_002102 [Polysphondylium violaceum]